MTIRRPSGDHEELLVFRSLMLYNINISYCIGLARSIAWYNIIKNIQFYYHKAVSFFRRMFIICFWYILIQLILFYKIFIILSKIRVYFVICTALATWVCLGIHVSSETILIE
jgi:hypothetical protein